MQLTTARTVLSEHPVLTDPWALGDKVRPL